MSMIRPLMWIKVRYAALLRLLSFPLLRRVLSVAVVRVVRTRERPADDCSCGQAYALTGLGEGSPSRERAGMFKRDDGAASETSDKPSVVPTRW